MTREDRNNKLKHFITCLKCEVNGKCCDDNCSTQYEAGNLGEIIENLEAISKALEQEPCDDAINSEEDLLSIVRKLCEERNTEFLFIVPTASEWSISDCEHLRMVAAFHKSLEQESKTGHWILTSDDDYEYCTCSECGYQNGENWMIGSQIKFCQECGAKMVEPQERSDKE